MTTFWLLILFFIDEFFIFSLRRVICKKYRNANGKDSNYTNAIDISIIWSCGDGVANAGSFIACIVSSVGIFIAWIVIRACSFIAFCDVLSMFILRHKEKGLKQTWIQFLIQPEKI